MINECSAIRSVDFAQHAHVEPHTKNRNTCRALFFMFFVHFLFNYKFKKKSMDWVGIWGGVIDGAESIGGVLWLGEQAVRQYWGWDW